MWVGLGWGDSGEGCWGNGVLGRRMGVVVRIGDGRWKTQRWRLGGTWGVAEHEGKGGGIRLLRAGSGTPLGFDVGWDGRRTHSSLPTRLSDASSQRECRFLSGP